METIFNETSERLNLLTDRFRNFYKVIYSRVLFFVSLHSKEEHDNKQDSSPESEKDLQTSDFTSATSDASGDDDLPRHINLLDLQDDVITDSGSPISPPLGHFKPDFNRSISHDDTGRSSRLRSILKRSKSDGASYTDDTDEEYTYTRTRALTHSDGYVTAKKNQFARRRNKSVTFSEEPLVFEFTKLSKRQWKKQQKDEKQKEAMEKKVHDMLKSSKKDSSKDEASSTDTANVKHGKKWRKKEKKEKKRLRNNSESRSEEESSEITSQGKKKSRKKKKNKQQNTNNPSSSPNSENESSTKPPLTNSLIYELE